LSTDAKQATVVEPFALTRHLIDLVTRIDGAVLIDLEGTCHAVGVILDGQASDICDPARGARYNSGVRYAYHQADRVVLVKSEDGRLNVLPGPT
jgi:DNA integrity scanning protein DisA with diadenylate cyclase activity